jgi:hypothetical protein
VSYRAVSVNTNIQNSASGWLNTAKEELGHILHDGNGIFDSKDSTENENKRRRKMPVFSGWSQYIADCATFPFKAYG